MSKEHLEKFCLLVLRDQTLQKQLKDISDRHEFIKKVQELSADKGFKILREDIESKMLEKRKSWNDRWI